jgi:FixJ family two-component response regulator
VAREPLIAVIDDDVSFRTALVESLSSLGYSVRDFASAEKFVAAGGEGLYGCVITDVHMPGMSGIDLKKLLTARGIQVPVVMITGRLDPGLEARAAASGAVCLLGKPLEANALKECLQEALKA